MHKRLNNGNECSFNPPPHIKQELHVSPIPERGEYKTIQEALSKAQANTTILIHPGVYNESLIITQNIHVESMQGEGSVYLTGEVPCLQIIAPKVSIKGLNIRGSVEKDTDRERAAVEIDRGEARLEGCRISSQSAGCVSVAGNRCKPTFIHCTIHNSQGYGIYFSDAALGTLKDCLILHNKAQGIIITQDKNQQKIQKRLFSAEDTFITTHQLARTKQLDKDNEISGHAHNTDAAIEIIDCQINGNQKAGIYLQNSGNVTLINNNILHNGHQGILIDGTSDLEATGCTVGHNAQSGIEVLSAEARLYLTQCTIKENRSTALMITNAEVEIENCQFHHSQATGIHINLQGYAIIRDCIFRGLGEHALRVSNQSEIWLKGGSITHYQPQAALRIDNESYATLQQCTIQAQAAHAILLKNHTSLEIIKCQVYSRQQFALILEDNSEVIARQCDLQAPAMEAPINSRNRCRIMYADVPGNKE